ncbi:PAS domain-containing protein [Dyadobacter luticola]|uniref:histidine kinase n=1 Tax=Dyadobacter luticola TaxID=1979387 RepID=A0A5R9L3E3_9BACT|nr:PAS domain-containing protein [Dyadobacter luticola]TLV02931.1 PAS domain S-box protein [Dyadobacter luticola]
MTNENISEVFEALPSPSIVLAADKPRFTITEVNAAYLSLTQKSRDALIGTGFFEAFPDLPPTRKEVWISLLDRVLEERQPNKTPVSRYARPAVRDGYFVITNTPVLDKDGAVAFIARSLTDVTEIAECVLHDSSANIESKRLEKMERLEKKILERNISNAKSIDVILTDYLSGIEFIFPKMRCAILSVRNNHLHNWAAPSLPVSYLNSIENVEIGPQVGSCGAAAFLKERIVASDIAIDPRWTKYREVALEHGLRACWSHPIIMMDQTVIATFAVYYDQIRYPAEEEIKVIDRAGAILKLILENWRIAEVSEQTRLELLASESRLRSLVDAQTNYVIRTDIFGNYTYYNSKFEQDFAWFYDHKNFLGVNCMQIVKQYDKKKVIETVADCMKNPGVVCPLEIDHISEDEDQQTAYWHFIALTDPQGKPVEIQCIGIDISERKKAADALKRSNERYELLNKAANDAIYDWDLVRDHIHWGDGFRKLFGFDVSEEQYPIEQWSRHIHPADKDRIREDLYRQLENRDQTKWNAEFRFKKADGTYAYVEDTGYIRRNRGGKPVRIIGVVRDVTERMRYVSEIEERNQKLQDIAWLQSHVIRAPLARLMGLVDLIQNYENSAEEINQLLDHILTSANDLDNIIRSISSKTAQV